MEGETMKCTTKLSATVIGLLCLSLGSIALPAMGATSSGCTAFAETPRKTGEMNLVAKAGRTGCSGRATRIDIYIYHDQPNWFDGELVHSSKTAINWRGQLDWTRDKGEAKGWGLYSSAKTAAGQTARSRTTIPWSK